MSNCRKEILKDMPEYIDYGKHRDLISFLICAGYLCDDEDADFSELIVVTEKNWLFNLMKKDGIDNPRYYLRNEYTSDDSIGWYEQAILNKKVVMVEFN